MLWLYLSLDYFTAATGPGISRHSDWSQSHVHDEQDFQVAGFSRLVKTTCGYRGSKETHIWDEGPIPKTRTGNQRPPFQAPRGKAWKSLCQGDKDYKRSSSLDCLGKRDVRPLGNWGRGQARAASNRWRATAAAKGKRVSLRRSSLRWRIVDRSSSSRSSTKLTGRTPKAWWFAASRLSLQSWSTSFNKLRLNPPKLNPRNKMNNNFTWSQTYLFAIALWMNYFYNNFFS